MSFTAALHCWSHKRQPARTTEPGATARLDSTEFELRTLDPQNTLRLVPGLVLGVITLLSGSTQLADRRPCQAAAQDDGRRRSLSATLVLTAWRQVSKSFRWVWQRSWFCCQETGRVARVCQLNVRCYDEDDETNSPAGAAKGR